MRSKQDQVSAPPPSRHDVWRMFDRIARRYDLLNRVLSFGRDVAWRKKVGGHLPEKSPLEILDLATGTADLLISIAMRIPRVRYGVGLDMASHMMAIGAEKIRKSGLSESLTLVRGDAGDIPFDDQTFDAVTIAFGIRNVIDVSRALDEMRRVLRPGGKGLILEFSLPSNRLVRSAYLLYFRHALPWIGGMVSGDRYAYSYLNKSVETFPYGEDFCDVMRSVGFQDVSAHKLTFGVATIYEGTRGH